MRKYVVERIDNVGKVRQQVEIWAHDPYDAEQKFNSLFPNSLQHYDYLKATKVD